MTLKRPIFIIMLVLITLLSLIYLLFDNRKDRNELDVQEVTNVMPETITVTRDNTHIRSGPSTDHEIISFAKRDSIYTIKSEFSDWYEIDLNGSSGFIWKYFVHPFNLSHDIKTDILKNKLIIIDAGHGGHDVGAIGARGTYEKDLTMKTTKLLERTLQRLHAKVWLTRQGDDYIRLGSRTSFTNLFNADAFLSIHYNSFPQQEDITGIGTYYYYNHSYYLARYIQDAIVAETNAINREIDFGNFQVLRESVNPAILLELGFISNGEQESRLLTNDYQELIVRGIIKGLIDYFHEHEKLMIMNE